MRVLSAFVSSFVFAAAVLEHPKLFVRAQAPEIGEWAGIRKSGEGHSFFKAVGGSFRVPHVRGDPDSAAFIGVTLGDSEITGAYPSQGCLNSVSISIGVLVFVNSSGYTHYNPAYQFFDQLHVEENNPRVISLGDLMLAFVLALRSTLRAYPTMAVLVNQSKSWFVIQTFQENIFHREGWSVCSVTAEWKVGTIRSNRFLDPTHFLPLSNFGEVIFDRALVIDSVYGIASAGRRNHEVVSLLHPGRYQVDAVIDEDDPSIIRISQIATA